MTTSPQFRSCTLLMFVLAVSTVSALALSACGGGGGGGGGGVAPSLSISTSSIPTATMNSAYSVTLQASGGTPPYKWSLSSGALPPGLSLNANSGLISGTPSASGITAFTVAVTDAGSQSASVQFTLTTSGATAARLNGHYAFQFSGFFNGYFTGVGSFMADGAGTISGGLVDTNGTGAVTANGSFTGTYLIGADNTGTMTLTYSGGAVVTYALAISGNGDARFIQYAASGVQGSGLIRKQDTSAFSSAQISGNYAFGFSGLDGLDAKRLALVGLLHADGVSAFSAGIADGNDNGTTLSNETVTGSYAVDGSGRGTATLNVTGLGTLNAVFYVISAQEFFLMEIDQVRAGNPLLAGDVVQQATGGFGTGSLNGTGVLQAIGLVGTSSAATLGFASVTIPGTLDLNADVNTGGTLSTLSESLSYSVAANGRVTTSGAANAPVLYLTATNQGFVLFSGSPVSFGTLEAQATGPFSNSSLSGSYEGGTLTLDSPGFAEADGLTADGSGNLSESFQSSDGTNLQQGTRSLMYSIAASGRASLSGSSGFLYLVSPTRIWVLGGGNPALSLLQQ